MKKKVIHVAACVSAMMLVLSGCTSAVDETESDYSGQTVTGKVISVDGSTTTLTLGEWTEDLGGGGDMPDKPDNSEADSSDSETPPEKPDGESSEDAAGNDGSAETPPEKPDGESSEDAAGNDGSAETPPEKPDGESNSDDSSAGSAQTGEAPSGETPSGEAPSGETPSGEGTTDKNHGTFTENEDSESITVDLADTEITGIDGDIIDYSSIEEGYIISVAFDESNAIEEVSVLSEGSAAGEPGGTAEINQGSAATTIDADGEYTDESYTSSGDDENALRVDGATVTLDGITIDKSGGSSSDTESGDFYGVNAAFLATNGANVTIKNADIKSSAQNGNGVFSYGEGTVVNISDSTITTEADNSGGIQTTGGGTTNASNLKVTTSGNSSAAIRSDRGGGTVNVEGGSYTSNGYNSPAVYSTARIAVKNAELIANNSEALVIEGENSIELTDCNVTGNMSDTEGTSSDENVHNIMIYQSMSGDAEEGTSSFSMSGGSLTSENGDMIYVTNTKCTVSLSDVDITNNDSDGVLLRVVGNSASRGWGNAGSNGGDVTMDCSNQKLDGSIIVDSISKLNLTLSDGSEFTGTINIVDNAEGGTAVDDNAVVTIDSGCTWNLTGDCTVTSLTNNGTINFNGYTITLADGTVLS